MADNEVGSSSLLLAVKSKNLKDVKYFVGHYRTLYPIDHYGYHAYTQLSHEAIKLGHTEIANFLLQEGSNVNSRAENRHRIHSSYDETLLVATELGNIETVNFILNLRSQHQYVTPKLLQFALLLSIVKNSNGEEIVSLLLKAGADPNGVVTYREGSFLPFFVACREGNSAIVKALLVRGANVEARDKDGMQPLHVAATAGHADLVPILLEFNANIDAQTTAGETALHCAMKAVCLRVVDVLLENECDVYIKNDCGQTASELAFSLSHSDGYMPYLSGCDMMISIFKRHFIKLKVAGLHVYENVLQLFDVREKLWYFSGVTQASVDFYQKCEEEVERMKSEVFLGHYTLHSVLIKRRNPVHMGNMSLVNALEAFDFSSYPIYKNLLVNTIKRSKERIKLISAAKESMSILVNTNRALNTNKLPILLPECLEEIVSHLSVRDLNSFISWGENFKRQLCKSKASISIN